MKLRACCLIYTSLISCGTQQDALMPQKQYIVSMKTLHQTLNFTGAVQPLHETAVTSPINGVIESMQHTYGDRVHAGDLIFTVISVELQKEFNNTFTEYLKAKENNRMAQVKFNGTRDLWLAGILAKNTFLSEQSGLNATRITLIQATTQLSELLKKLGEPGLDHLTNLSFDEFSQVQTALSSTHNRIKVLAPCDGIFLYPPKNERSETEQLHTGSSIKSGQVLGLMGDLNGISLSINVPEVDIPLVHVGLPAIIHGVAFDSQGLNGCLTSVNSEALKDNSGGLASFNATVNVSTLSPAQQKWIKVGMSATIELQIDTKKTLLIPIAAVTPRGNQHIVRILAPGGKSEQRSVITGAVHDDQVVITSGLRAGDVLLYD